MKPYQMSEQVAGFVACLADVCVAMRTFDRPACLPLSHPVILRSVVCRSATDSPVSTTSYRLRSFR